MAMIDKYIKELVQSNRRVIIPDLGAFLLKETPKGTKTIIFSSFLRYNDGLLEEAIVQRAKLDKSEALIAIRKFVDEISRAMRNKKHYEIADFGYFAMDNKGTIQFLPFNDINDTLLQGTNSADEQPKPIVNADVVDNTAVNTVSNNVTAKPPITVDEVLPPQTVTAKIDSVKTIHNEHVTSKKRSRLLWIIIFLLVIIIFLLTLLYLCSTNSDLCFFRKKTSYVAPPQIATMPVTRGQNNITVDSSKVLSPLSPTTVQGLNYHVIAGCFSEKINAERFLQQALERGYTTAEILPKIGELYPVSVAKSPDLKEAERIRIDYNANHDDEAWLYRTY